MSALACLALAAAACCAPVPAAARLRALWPTPARRWPGPRSLAGPVVLGAVAGAVLAGPGGAVAGVLLAVTLRHRRARARATSAAAAASSELADAVGRIAEELRAGSHPAAALAGVRADGPLAQEILAPAAAAARLGDGVAAALRRGAGEPAHVGGDVERVALAWTLAERHGIPLAELLGRVHEDIRWRVRFGATVRAQLAGPRATATILTALPLLGIGLGQLVGADPIGVLRGGALGQVLLVVGVALAAAGMAWAEQILRAAVPR
ncbi:type II secretion system F family protein [Pseudonocardia nigra]|uniref:type II secretion system F family protein n=1 Tax=Pseudonocardia nigra TaxID=1921578 RepID=UPI001C5FE7B7|nr:secretion system protein [Pseudonocardia nigra]